MHAPKEQGMGTICELHIDTKQKQAILNTNIGEELKWDPVFKPTGDDVFRKTNETNDLSGNSKLKSDLVMKLTDKEEEMIKKDDEHFLKFKTIKANSNEETEFEVNINVGYPGIDSETLRKYKRTLLEYKRVFAKDESEVTRIKGYAYDMLFKNSKVIRHPQTKLAPRDREACKEIIDKMVVKGDELPDYTAINRKLRTCEGPEPCKKLSIASREKLKALMTNKLENKLQWYFLVRCQTDLSITFCQRIIESPYFFIEAMLGCIAAA